MPKGHPISVPRTWPGHRDYEPRIELPVQRPLTAERAALGPPRCNCMQTCGDVDDCVGVCAGLPGLEQL